MARRIGESPTRLRKVRRLLPTILLGLLFPWHAVADELLLVMLQGPEMSTVRAAAEKAGATITHDLPIIDAIGARMSRDQLERLRAQLSPAVRVIDDLAWTPEPEPPSDADCHLAGAIELSWRGSSMHWRLYNKGPSPLAPRRLELAWPDRLGPARRISFAGVPAVDATTSSPAQLDMHQLAEIPAGGHADLTLEFAKPPALPAAVQAEIQARAIVSDSCATELVASYPAPSEDSYFAGASGASLLHSHGITGRNVTVAVLDSGLWEEPEALRRDTRGSPRVAARFDAIVGRRVDALTDESGHGTHISSVIARSDRTQREGSPQPSYRGIAPDARIVAVKAFGETGEAGFLDIVRGIQWVVEQREALDIRILNLSFAARPRWPYWEDPVNQALMRAWQTGIFIVAAAGNEGPEPMTIGSPGNLPYLLTVGAVTDSWTEGSRHDDYIPDFSSRGPTPLGHIKPDLVAYGGHIAGITRPGSTLARDFPEYFLSTREFVMTGSSQAAAVVSGLAALLLQLDPTLTNDEIKCMFKTTAEPAIAADGRLAYSPFHQGDGLVSVQRALTIGAGECEQQALNLKADIAGIDHYQGPAIFSDEAPPSLPGAEELIAPPPAQEGPVDDLRWGVHEHLQRLTSPEGAKTPIDWARIYAEELTRMEAAAAAKP